MLKWLPAGGVWIMGCCVSGGTLYMYWVRSAMSESLYVPGA